MKKIVIAGAGFGGIRATLDLSKYLPNENITLINDTPYHCFHADLYEAVSALLKKEGGVDFKNLRCTLNIPLSKIFKGKNVDILIDTITEADLEKKVLFTQNSKALEYDLLVLGLGSTTNYYGIEGAKEFSHPLKTAEDALNIRNDLEELISSGNHKTITVIIAGGGYTGVETAGQLMTFLKNLCRKYGQNNAKVLILEASENLLSGMPGWSQELALKKLRELGAEIKLNTVIAKVEKNTICSDNNLKIQFDYLIWTAGVIGANLNNRIKGAAFNKKGQIETKQDLSLEKYPDVFVIGDLAECLDQKRGCFVPSTAWGAIGQGSVVAKNILARLKDKPTINYQPPAPVFVVPVGRKFALSNLANFKITDTAGWFLKRMVALKYFLSILPAFEAISIWRKGVNIYSANE